MPVRMKDIAHDLGISIVTVSKVLRDHPDISAETRDRVLQKMKEVNYRPEPRRPRAGYRPDVQRRPGGPRPGSSVFRRGGQGHVPRVAQERLQPGHFVFRRGSGTRAAGGRATPRTPRGRADHRFRSNHIQMFRRIEEQKTPYVLVDRKFAGLSANFTGVDDEAAGRIATGHLISLKRRRIAHIGGPAVSTATGRRDGYRAALAAHNIALNPNFLIVREHGDDASDRSGYEAMRQLLSLSPRPDAVFCYNDPTAMGAMEAIFERGLRIPQDIAIVGCGNVRYAGFLRVPLTTIDQQSEEIGDRSAKLALAQIEAKGAARPKTVLLEPRLVVRQSA